MFKIGDFSKKSSISIMKKMLVQTGWGESSLTKYRNSWIDTVPDYITENLLDAAYWIEENLRT